MWNLQPTSVSSYFSYFIVGLSVIGIYEAVRLRAFVSDKFRYMSGGDLLLKTNLKLVFRGKSIWLIGKIVTFVHNSGHGEPEGVPRPRLYTTSSGNINQSSIHYFIRFKL